MSPEKKPNEFLESRKRVYRIVTEALGKDDRKTISIPDRTLHDGNFVPAFTLPKSSFEKIRSRMWADVLDISEGNVEKTNQELGLNIRRKV